MFREFGCSGVKRFDGLKGLMVQGFCYLTIKGLGLNVQGAVVQ
jgi:hypothetical protein